MKYPHYSLFALLLLLLTSQVSAYEQQSINITVNGKQRNMVVFTPNTLPEKSPLFIVTHGMNQDPEYQYGSDKLYELIDTAKFVVTYLRSDGNTWDIGGTNDQNFVSKAIDEMYTRYNIDKDRVYWSGFSMGSMLIHHCIANMQNKIAAFAPTSGIQFSEQPWNKCQKPVNLLECIAYDDDVFGYEQYGIHAYIENYAKHDKHTQYSKTVYQPGWYDGDLEKWTGGANGGEVWLFSYHSGGHWPMTDNRKLIWNFCKRFSLNQPKARITVPAGETTHLCMAPEGEATFHDFAIEATAQAQQGEIVKADIYDGTTLLQTLTAAPYTATLTAPAVGTHDVRMEVMDSNGKTGEASCLINCVTSETTYDLSGRFNMEGIVPQDWYVSNGTGSSTRVGGGLPFTNGPRLLHFTNESKGFEYGLLIQNAAGGEKAAWAKFGDASGRSTMTLHTGHYTLSFRLYNWEHPEHVPVTVALEDANGQTVASTVITPTKNIGGNTANAFTSIRPQKFEFTVAQTGDYVIVFYTGAAKDDDFVVGRITLKADDFNATGIMDVRSKTEEGRSDVYDLQGRKVSPLNKGLYIVNGRKVVLP